MVAFPAFAIRCTRWPFDGSRVFPQCKSSRHIPEPTAAKGRPTGASFAAGGVAAVDFAALKLGEKPNQFLMCPTGLCGAGAHAESPIFEVPVDRLCARWEAVAGGPGGRQFDYVHRSARFRFPDIVTVRLIAVSPSRSSLAVYSRAIYGRRDFGVNRARIEFWLADLREGL